MKNSIYNNIRKYALIMACIFSAVFILIMIAQFIVIRQTVLTINNDFGDSAAENAKEMLVELSEIELELLVKDKAALIDEHLTFIAKNVERMTYAANTILKDTRYTEQEAMLLLQRLILVNIAYNDIDGIGASYYGTEKGEFYINDNSGVIPSNRDMRERPWYVAAKEADTLIWTDVYEDQEGRGLSITCAMPYYFPDGTLAGIAGIGTTINNMLETVIETPVGDTGEAFMLDKTGRINIAKDLQRDTDGNTIHSRQSERASEIISSALVAAAASDNTEPVTGMQHIHLDDMEKIVAFQRLYAVPWVFVVIVDASEVVSPALRIEENINGLKESAITSVDDSFIQISIIAGVSIIAFSILVMYFSGRLAKRITTPIAKLTTEAEHIGKGNLDHSLEVNTGDELETLADAINKMIASIKDITAEKERLNEDMIVEKELHQKLETIAYREKEANQLKSRFLATMSHEIRTPMNAIIGMSELALRDETVEAKNEHIQTVKEASSNLLAIINDILDFSKIEAGKLQIKNKDYSVSSLLCDLVSIIRMKVIDSQIRFAVIADSTIPETLYGDELRVRQAVLNILSNAVKYTDKGFVTFGIYGEFVNVDTINIIFEVTDSGIGIKPEDMDALFSDFIRLDSEKNKEIEGIGLGLSITQNIIKAMDGDIQVKSEYGKGSAFTITLPQKFRSREPLAKVSNAAAKSVLVFERRKIYAQAIIYTIENLGAKPALAVNETELHNKLASNSYDFLFISHSQYRKYVSVIHKLAKDTRVVILSGFGDSVLEKDADVLTMPVYCTSVADILNGTRNDTSYNTGGESTVRFSAPDARVLVVDDVMTNLKVAEGLLLPYRLDVDLCNGGASAIETVKNTAAGRYDLIFMDHKMPGIDGVEAVRQIRALAKEDAYFGNVPIIALTANAVSGTKEMFLENGFNDYLAKPINTVRLNAILERWIPKNKQTRR